jgi:hypothetical protein
MKLTGPARYRVSILPSSEGRPFEITDDNGKPNFTAPATSSFPKLYIVTARGEAAPIYVGITRQSIRTRLRLGWTAKGQSGYYGYRWRRDHKEVALDVWCDTDPEEQKSLLDVETIEAEIVFLIRQKRGQWPSHQTEIHFHPSRPYHRKAAEAIVNRYLRSKKLAAG